MCGTVSSMLSGLETRSLGLKIGRLVDGVFPSVFSASHESGMMHRSVLECRLYIVSHEDNISQKYMKHLRI